MDRDTKGSINAIGLQCTERLLPEVTNLYTAAPFWGPTPLTRLLSDIRLMTSQPALRHVHYFMALVSVLPSQHHPCAGGGVCQLGGPSGQWDISSELNRQVLLREEKMRRKVNTRCSSLGEKKVSRETLPRDRFCLVHGILQRENVWKQAKARSRAGVGEAGGRKGPESV